MSKTIIAPRILVLEGLYADTADLVTDAGGVGIEASPWNWTDVQAKLKSGTIDGLLLTGGGDVNPLEYGQEPCPLTQSPDHMRDFVELECLKYARANKIPVLGICRGSQIMCVSQGGTLIQDIPLYTEAWTPHQGSEHRVIACGTTFKRACNGEEIDAVSLHHQCVNFPGYGMRIAARAFDGTPEAIESKDGLMLGVQFHPEMTAYKDPMAFSIFRWLVETAARRAGGKAKAVNFRDAADDYHERLAYAWHHYKVDADPDDTYSTGWQDDEGTTSGTQSTSAASPGGRARGTTTSHRKAGDPAIPSMREDAPSQREMVKLIEMSTGQSVTVLDKNGRALGETIGADPAWPWREPAEVIEGEYCPLPTDTPRSGYLDDASANAILERELLICPTCHVRFDLIEDCDDHKKYVHPVNEQTWAQRFADMNEPPLGDDAWEDLDDLVMKHARQGGFEPTDWDKEFDYS
jgi:putative glutamine amidotransferase